MQSSNSHRKLIIVSTVAVGALGVGALCFAFIAPSRKSNHEANLRPEPKHISHTTYPDPNDVPPPELVKVGKTIDKIYELTFKGDGLLKDGKVDEAEKLYQEALVLRKPLEKEPGYSAGLAWIGLAKIADLRGDLDAARKAYWEGFAEYRNNPQVRRNGSNPVDLIRYSELCRDARDAQEERWAYRTILGAAQNEYLEKLWGGIEPPEGDDAGLRGRAYVIAAAGIVTGAVGQVEEYLKAIHHYDKAILANPKDAVAFFMQGEALFLISRYSEAKLAYANALKNKPQTRFLMEQLGDSTKTNNRVLAHQEHRSKVIPAEEWKKSGVSVPVNSPRPHKFPGELAPGYVYEFRDGKWGIFKKNP